LERSGNATFEFHSNDLVTSCSDLKPQPVGHVCTSLTTAAANDPRMNPVGGDVDVYLTPLNNFGAHSPHAEATFYIRSCFSTWCAVVPHRSSVCPRRQNILVTRPVPGRLRRRRLQKRRRDGRPLLYVCRGHSEPEYPQYRVHLFVGLRELCFAGTWQVGWMPAYGGDDISDPGWILKLPRRQYAAASRTHAASNSHPTAQKRSWRWAGTAVRAA
jgi:hypothetical protein